MVTSEILSHSVQINNGLAQTCADGPSLAFDTKYGIMFCAYMPGYHGDYGESRGKISLSYFPASQPTNAKHLDVAVGDDVYVPNIISLGEGRVRVFWEKDSRADCDHTICYKDFDYISETLSEEKVVFLKKDDGTTTPLCLSECFLYLEKNGYNNHVYRCSEQIIFGGTTLFKGEDGNFYGAVVSELSEVILYRSRDAFASVEFFAVYPRQVQYEFDYKFFGDKIYAVYRTNNAETGYGNVFTYSEDGGKTWSEAENLENSIRCRPRLIVSGARAVIAYNYYDDNTGNRPFVVMGRTAIKIATVNDSHEVVVLGDLHTKYGIVNLALVDVLGDVYMAYCTSETALEYQNGTPHVRGKDAVRYVNLGNVFI